MNKTKIPAHTYQTEMQQNKLNVSKTLMVTSAMTVGEARTG